MFKKIVLVILALTLIGAAGCSLGSKSTSTTAPAAVNTVREATISKVWSMKQLQIDLDKSIAIVLTLKDGDKVDGYFYVLKGELAAFNISGNSPFYASKSTDTETSRITSDKFSFTASQAQGVAYTLNMTASSSASGKASVFLELMYPSTGSMFVPIGTK
jgi:hypothetical protein